jgi:hypothetical protein
MTRRRRPKTVVSPPPEETRAVEFLTVAWMVSVMSVLLFEVMAVAAHFYVRSAPPAPMMEIFKVLALFSASVIGMVSLVLLVAVVRLRRIRPPHGLLVFSVIVSIAPLVAVALREILR